MTPFAANSAASQSVVQTNLHGQGPSGNSATLTVPRRYSIWARWLLLVCLGGLTSRSFQDSRLLFADRIGSHPYIEHLFTL